MNQGAHDAGGGFGQSVGGSPARGILVIAAAVIIGLILLQQGLSDSGIAQAEPNETTSSSAVGDSTTGSTTVDSPDTAETTDPVAETTVVTLGVARPAGEVAVLVLNGTEGPVAGIAGAGANKLKTNNYVTRDPKNATVPSPSAIFYADGFEAEAIAVASVLGADPAVVVKPLDVATVPIADTQSADIVVVVGNDGVIVV